MIELKPARVPRNIVIDLACGKLEEAKDAAAWHSEALLFRACREYGMSEKRAGAAVAFLKGKGSYQDFTYTDFAEAEHG